MATKSKAKSTPAKSKKPAKQKTPKGPLTTVSNHPFPAGTKVAFFPAVSVDLERRLNREPTPKPTATAKVAKDGTLKVSGLAKGQQWAAAAEVDDRWHYFNFAVN